MRFCLLWQALYHAYSSLKRVPTDDEPRDL